MSTEKMSSLDAQVAAALFDPDFADPYSTDIDTAFEVVEEMGRRGWRFALKDYTDLSFDPEYLWEATFRAQSSWVRAGKKNTAYSSIASTPAEAICLAALAAVRGEKGETCSG